MKNTSRTPLREQVRQWIQQGIRDGDFPDGTPIPSLNALFRKFGMARETVRQALESLVKEGVLAPQQGRGYFVKPRGSRILRVALVARTDGVYLAPIYRGLISELGAAASVLVADPQGSPDNLRRLAENFARAHHIDRVLLIPPRGREEEFSEVTAPFRRHFRLAWIDRAPAACRDHCFLPDYKAGVRMAIEHFAARGVKAPGYFTRTEPDRSVYSLMRRSYAATLRRRGHIPAFWTDASEAIAAIGTAPGPMGILAENDFEAVHLLSHLSAVGCRVPSDAMVISCDNSRWTDQTRPTLTSVDPGFEQLGVAAARWILGKPVDSSASARMHLQAPRLVEKESTSIEPLGGKATPDRMRHPARVPRGQTRISPSTPLGFPPC